MLIISAGRPLPTVDRVLELVGEIAREALQDRPRLCDEYASSLDVMRIRSLVATDQYDPGIGLVEAVVGMLAKMI